MAGEPSSNPDSRAVYTIGHSTHPIEEFVALLEQHQIAALADVRSYPSSRRWPQFNQAELSTSLKRAGIEYSWMKVLGGRRHGVNRESPHLAWKVAAFRSYADYADGDEFAAGLALLRELAAPARTAVMCAEGLWWQCHRRIISDHLLISGAAVIHIMPDGKTAAHSLPGFARLVNGRIVYDVAREESK